ncbi:MAG: hypothetical protein K9J37_11840 [Saprospiraceae bacterium]|nr:hypothetical protein [Saprospiraceae bacterium]MCF8250599.1 hypothetical protein [Saprospiraceae bacterium]MCF8281415.1 hypothetical protein [Bacteroidales bacterium]MCF8313082.1 hypothetical protein [Saprospiraceae bacterium]MCF8441554.1 hypothetical protein [Saprospiraceae bacterium]
MQQKKEIQFQHDGQDYFISQPEPLETYPVGSPYREFLAWLESKGVTRRYNVEVDVRGRYLTVYVDKSLAFLMDSHHLPDFVEIRQGKAEPYLYFAEHLHIIAYDATWLELVDGIWKGSK